MGDPKAAASWYPQIKAGFQALEDLLSNWETITVKNDGDAVRRYLGTVGTSSPLFGIKKAFVGVRDADDVPEDVDVVTFTELYLDVLTAIGDAENDAYSANFADFSGGGHLSAGLFIGKAKERVTAARDAYKDLMAVLNLK